MVDEDVSVLYDGLPIQTGMAAWVLLGIGGIVLVPIGLLGRAWWLFVPAVPLLLAGLILLQVRLRIVIEYPAGSIRVTNRLLGLKYRERRYHRSDLVGFDIHRVAGAERERPSDTWYLRLRLGIKTFTIGRYDSRLSAVRARAKINKTLQARTRAQAAGDAEASPG
jgi:hypothetical protein